VARPAVGPPDIITFQLRVKSNSPPYFTGSLSDQYMYYNETKSYLIPRPVDSEDTIYVSASLEGFAYLPGFIRYD